MKEELKDHKGNDTGLVTIEQSNTVQISAEQIAAKLAKIEKAKVIGRIDETYWNAEKNDTFRGVFVGWGEQEKTDQATGEVTTLLVVRFSTAKNGIMRCGQVKIKSAMIGRDIGTMVQVTALGKVAGKNVKDFKIEILG